MNLKDYEKLQPIDDKVVIRRQEGESKTKSGVFLPTQSQQDAKYGIIVAVGLGMKEMTSSTNEKHLLTENNTIQSNQEIKRIGMGINVGDKVLFSEIHGMKFSYNDEDLIIQREGEILCILND